MNHDIYILINAIIITAIIKFINPAIISLNTNCSRLTIASTAEIANGNTLIIAGYGKSGHATHWKTKRQEMQQMSAKMQQQVEWRRAKVMELLSKGESNQSEIARILQVDKSIVCRNIAYLRQQSRTNIKKYIDERLQEEYEKCLVGLNAITREAWNTAHNTEDKREKIQALSLAKECYSISLICLQMLL